MASVTAATLNLIVIVTLNKVNIKTIRINIITNMIVTIKSSSTLVKDWTI